MYIFPLVLNYLNVKRLKWAMKYNTMANNTLKFQEVRFFFIEFFLKTCKADYVLYKP